MIALVYFIYFTYLILYLNHIWHTAKISIQLYFSFTLIFFAKCGPV